MTFEETIAKLRKKHIKISDIKKVDGGYTFKMGTVQSHYYNTWENTGKDYTDYLLTNYHYQTLINNVIKEYK